MYINAQTAMKEFFIEHYQWILTSIAFVVAWFRKEITNTFKRKVEEDKTEANINSVNIENLSKSLEIYKNLFDDIVPRYEDQLGSYRIQLNRYHDQLEKYRKELKERDIEIVSLHKEINELRSRIIQIEKHV